MLLQICHCLAPDTVRTYRLLKQHHSARQQWTVSTIRIPADRSRECIITKQDVSSITPGDGTSSDEFAPYTARHTVEHT